MYLCIDLYFPAAPEPMETDKPAATETVEPEAATVAVAAEAATELTAKVTEETAATETVRDPPAE